ncbi:uncharacterized protein TRIADDRAFT_57885 [Trichoplax adhaerens]|uniref:Vitellogenin domain-containing protein n=1 Tax=Trichoplax adhaerens TaxID=10228 RepID=B3S1U2_TRIAD|nr:predicted protein [Trichoplax adhaerens]EDV23352.1 predicted protein [Trichoplax adhaerens]|eukprot:XP_002114262.1 predicted protein [Trichoplax adhaerens]
MIENRNGISERLYFHPDDINYSTNLKRGAIELLQFNNSIIKSNPEKGVTVVEACIRGRCHVTYYPCRVMNNCYDKINTGLRCSNRPLYPSKAYSSSKGVPQITESASGRQELSYLKDKACDFLLPNYFSYDESSILYQTDLETFNKFDYISYILSLKGNGELKKPSINLRELSEEYIDEEVFENEMV